MPTKPLSLRSLQAQMATDVRTRSVSRALKEAIAETPTFPRAKRLGVYSTAYELRLRESLAQDFETVAHLVGAPRFAALVRDYLKAHPSTSFNIGDVGLSFTKFLKRRRLPAALIEVARLDEHLTQSFYADESEAPSTPEQWVSWTTRPERELLAARARLDTSVRLETYTYPVTALWYARTQKPRRRLPTVKKTEYVLIYRTPRWVWAEPVSKGEFEALRRLQKGAPLKSLERLKTKKIHWAPLFQRWVSNGILRTLDFPSIERGS